MPQILLQFTKDSFTRTWSLEYLDQLGSCAQELGEKGLMMSDSTVTIIHRMRHCRSW